LQRPACFGRLVVRSKFSTCGLFSEKPFPAGQADDVAMGVLLLHDEQLAAFPKHFQLADKFRCEVLQAFLQRKQEKRGGGEGYEEKVEDH
jgi:hypothetical protein